MTQVSLLFPLSDAVILVYAGHIFHYDSITKSLRGKNGLVALAGSGSAPEGLGGFYNSNQVLCAITDRMMSIGVVALPEKVLTILKC